MKILTTLILLTGCSRENSATQTISQEPGEEDNAAVVFGPSLTEMFYISGAWQRVAAVDRFSTWPPEAEEIAIVGDFLSPSLEMIAALGATSIHVVGRNQALADLAERLDIPYYQYSFDRLDDVYQSCSQLESLYPDANLDWFQSEIEHTMDSVSVQFTDESPEVMIVIYLEGDGAISLAGRGTFFSDILTGIGCVLSAPDSGTYPAVSVEGILALDPDFVVILDPYSSGQTPLDNWRENGLDDTNVVVLSEDFVLVPGARLKDLIIGLAQCLN